MRRSFALLALAGTALLVDAACSAKLSLDNRACPCVVGYECCELQDICLPEGELCTSGKSPKRVPEGEDNDDTVGTTSSTDDVTASKIAVTSSPVCFTTDAEAAYWMNADGSINGVRTSAGAPLVLRRFAVPAEPVTACGMARTGGDLFVTLSGGGSVLRLSVATNDSGEIALGDKADRIGVLTTPVALAADGNDLYVVEGGTKNAITHVNVATGATTDLGPIGATVTDFILTKDDLVWRDENGIARKSRTPGGNRMFVSPDPGLGLTAHDGAIFYRYDGELFSAPLSGGARLQYTGHVPEQPDPNRFISRINAFAFDGPVAIVESAAQFHDVSLDGKLARTRFRYRPSEQGEQGRMVPLFLSVDASRYVWASLDSVWLVRRSADGGVERRP